MYVVTELDKLNGKYTEDYKKVSNLPVMGGLGGWLSPIEVHWLIDFFQKNDFSEKPIALELGVFAGNTSLIFLLALPTCILHVIDNFQEKLFHPTVSNQKDGFEKTILPYKDRVIIHEGDSVDIGNSWNTPLDIAFIDGNHYENYPYNDIKNFKPWVKSGGYIMVDDYSMKIVKSAIDSLLYNDKNYECIASPNKGLVDLVVFRKN